MRRIGAAEMGMMPLRRWVTLVILVVVVIVGVTWLRNENGFNTPKVQSSVAVSDWFSAMGAVSSSDTGFEKQKLSFSATIWNNTNRTVYVTNLRVKLPISLQNHVLSGSTVIAVNKSLTPKATDKITGHFILDTKGLTKEQIVKLGNIKGFSVVYAYSNPNSGITWVVPANVAWNGYYYETKGYVTKIGSKLGIASYPSPAQIYSIIGQNPDHEVAVEVDTPNGKYVSAVRVKVGTKTSPIPSNWMTITTPKLEVPIRSGDRLAVSGTVFFRELYGTTVGVGIKRQGAKYPQILAKKAFQVSMNGTVHGTFNIPKDMLRKPKKTQYLLVFQDTSKQYPTTTYYFPMILR